jgi:protein-tyrosine phosphatase
LFIMARPRGGDWLTDEIRAWRNADVDVVVSLLTSAEQDELGLGDEASLCQDQQLVFRAFPISDRGIPHPYAPAEQLIEEIVHALRAGEHVAIHCRMGIGRCAMIAAAALVGLGERPESAFATIEAARGLSVPDTPEQRQWVEGYAIRQRT